MLVTISTTHHPATDLGFLLHKHPAHVHSRKQSYGTAHVFFSEATDDRCTAVLSVDVDPVGLVRDRQGFSGSGLMDQYVNDRPYAASSLLSAALNDSFGSAMAGRSTHRPELTTQAIPLVFHLPVLPSRGGESLLRSLFEPLGYAVEVQRLPLDPKFPAWGDSAYFAVTLTATLPLALALSHLYVLIPVLDNAKHYWVGEDEVDKLLRKSEPWLGDHPQREIIVRRYLKNRTSLARQALARLVEADGSVEDADTAAGPTTDVVRGDKHEQSLEKPLSLNEQRLRYINAAIDEVGATSVIDLGCGEGRLLAGLLKIGALRRLTGVDVSHRALEIAADRMHLDRLPTVVREKLSLLHGSLVYRDRRFEGYDVASVVEVIEHLDEDRLEAFSRVLFEFARPKTIFMTTPNREYNVRFPQLDAGRFRHPDHRFEWTRAEFEAWAHVQAERHGYGVRFDGIGDRDSELGPPTQVALFTFAR